MLNGEKKISSTRIKGVNYNTPVHCVSWNPIFLQNLKSVGATVIEIHEFNRMEKKKKKNMKYL